MKSISQKRLGTFASLTVLLLLTFAAAAHASTAAGSAASPPAGTEGRGGVAALPQPAPGQRPEAFVSRARGGFPAWPAGIDATATVASSSSASTGWIAAGLVTAAAVFIIGFLAWAASRRRVWLKQSPLGSYCTYHPADSLC